MKQNLNLSPKIKQTHKLNLKMQKSLDFLKLDNNEINEQIELLLQSNPFVDYNSYKQYDDNYLENIGNSPSLQDELYEQLYTIQFKYNKRIISYIIDSLDDKGFLSYSLDTYLSDLKIHQDDFNYHLDIVQSFEPIGVAAKNSIDSIMIQLKYHGYIEAYELMNDFLHYIVNQDYKSISKKKQITLDKTKELFDQIKSCNPFPCSKYSSIKNEIIIPDIFITIENNEILITPHNHPNIIINEELFKQVASNDEMKKYFEEANFFLDSLSKRNQTVMMVSDALIKIQKNYFLFNDELQSCTLSDIAIICRYHESTISRTINNKYYEFNNQIYSLKHLLVSKSLSGDSSDAIKKAMVLIIANENKHKPLSDQQILLALQAMDLQCSRRAINKYRSQLKIPSSSKRKV